MLVRVDRPPGGHASSLSGMEQSDSPMRKGHSNDSKVTQTVSSRPASHRPQPLPSRQLSLRSQ